MSRDFGKNLCKNVAEQPLLESESPLVCEWYYVQLSLSFRFSADPPGRARLRLVRRLRLHDEVTLPRLADAVVPSFWQNFGKMLLVFGCIKTKFCK